MSNNIEIEDTERDEDMDGEIHDNPNCKTVDRDGTYTDYKDGRTRTLEVLFIFMDCRCKTKSSNPLFDFDKGISIARAECIDIHLPGRGCCYERYPKYGDKQKHRFKCFCYCRKEHFSHPHGE